MEESHENGIPFFQFVTIPEPGAQQHAIFTRRGGMSQGPFASLNMSTSVADDPGLVHANRQRAYGIFGRTPDGVVYAHLVHDNDVARVTAGYHGRLAGRVDGLITDEPGCALAMNFADCAPIFIFDPAKRAIALGHAGWQGAVKDLPGALVAAMKQAFGSNPADLWAGIGPSIGSCCYEVGEPVVSAVRAQFQEPDALLVQNGGTRPYFDLPEANRRRLLDAGVHRIESATLCTACHTELFFSHRAERGRTGRFGALFFLP